MTDREKQRQYIRQRAEALGITITEDPAGGYRLFGRNGFIDYRVIDLADVLERELAPQRWA
jgi:hypothetical protein